MESGSHPARMPPSIQRFHPSAQPDQMEPLAGMLCRAFDKDAHINWIVRQDARRGEAFHGFFRLLLADLASQHGEIYATEDLKAAALCFPPGNASIPLSTQLRIGMRFGTITGWTNLPLRAFGLNRMEARHPGQPHVFLQTIGVDPEFQGMGYGSALLKALTRQWDAQGIPAYLETSREANLGFYEKHGFRVISSASLPRGPVLWQLLRKPVR